MDSKIEPYKHLIDEYEKIIPSLKDQLEHYKKNNEVLKEEFECLNSDYKNLVRKFEEVMCRQSNELFSYTYKDSQFIENLKSQLKITVKEKQSVSELWQNSLKQIDSLESELKSCSIGTQFSAKNAINKIQKINEKQVMGLQKELKISQLELEKTIQMSDESMKVKNAELDRIASLQNKTTATVEKLETELNALQEKQSEMQSLKAKLEDTIDARNKTIADLKIESYNAKLKVAEACHVVEVALIEKDAAIARETEAQVETHQLSTVLQDALRESEFKLKHDVRSVRDEYENKLKKCKTDWQRTERDLKEKSALYEERSQQYNELLDELTELRQVKFKLETQSSSEINNLTRRIEEANHKTIKAERTNMQLNSHIDTLKATIEQLTQSHEMNMNNKELERALLAGTVRKLQTELEMSNSKLMQFALKVEELNNKVKEKTHQMYHECELKSAQSERLLNEKISEIEAATKRSNTEIRSHLRSQHDLNGRWKTEVRTVTGKLESRIHDLKREVGRVKKGQKEMEVKLVESESRCSLYKDHLVNLCSEFNEIASMFTAA